MTETIIVNGEHLSVDAKISVDDRGFTLGDGLFETVPVYDGKAFLLEKHLERMEAGAIVTDIPIPFNRDEIIEGIKTLCRDNRISRGVARLTVTRGVGPRGYGVTGCDNPAWLLTVRPYSPPSEEKRAAGYKLAVSNIRRNAQSPLNAIKSTSAMEKIVALNLAQKDGADEALVLSTDGHIASCASANIFGVSGGELFTPSLDCGALPGVTRQAVIELAGSCSIKVSVGNFQLDALYGADELFVTNSLLEIMPVTNVAGIFDAKTQGDVTLELCRRYGELICK